VNSHYEPLEPRLVLSHAEPDLISVGRVLSSWSASDVVDGQLKVTYSVYNQQADEVSGVLLTTTLEPGVMFVGASVLPDRSGQELAWSLGTLDPFGRASVEVTVALASPMQLAIDDGAEAFGTLYARAVSDEAHAAVLRSEPIDADLLRSTPDANTTDPFILAKAAELNQDATEIFHYLTHEVGYGSYVGSLRGARGTLWSSAGNALDEASLGIALLRSSGIPARYAQGTLPDNLAQELILSMFPESFQVVGYIPPGADVADPAHDPRLLAETREHYWIQFDAGAGMQDIDTTFAHAEPGQTFAEASGTFGEVPDALRHKVTVRLKAEVINQLSSLFFAGPPEASTVLEQAFNAAELVGRPITVGHFVSSSTLPSPIFVSTTINYSPYLTIGDVAFPPADDEVVRGTDFQEVRTNFPLGSQTVTGVFLEIETFGDGATSVYQKTIADRIGLAARRGGAASVSIDPEGPPLISPLDMMTISVSPSLFDRRGLLVYTTQLAALETEFDALQAQLLDTGIPDGPQGEELAQRATDFFRALVATSSRAQLASFQVASDLQTEAISSGLGIRAYHDSPRLLIVDTKASLSDEGILELRQSLDLL
jgi:hypothetical protein